jgi:uncharacterized membrane protein
MTQSQLVKKYVQEFGFITPAKCIGRNYGGGFFGAELSRVCRALRKEGVLDSRPEGKFEKFYFKENTPIVFNKVPQAYISGISVPIYAAPKKQIKVESQQNLL